MSTSKALPPIGIVTNDIMGTSYWTVDTSKVDAPKTLAKMRRQSVGVSFKKSGDTETVYFQSDYMFLAMVREHMGLAPVELPKSAEEQNGSGGGTDAPTGKGKGGKGKG